ncbi:MAG TPA: ArsC family reductase [Rhodocyclaceae bacterium]|jgi:arsenate reductase|nr:ArsC family reductase [Rhodocyclaceae bacterium]
MSESVVHLYGIKNCDTMKKALTWVSEHGVEYQFHDYKKEGVDRNKLVEWCKVVGWKSLVNTKGTTWKKLTPEQQAVTAQGQAVALMMEYPSLIRRPVVEANGQLLIGFDQTLFEGFVK